MLVPIVDVKWDGVENVLEEGDVADHAVEGHWTHDGKDEVWVGEETDGENWCILKNVLVMGYFREGIECIEHLDHDEDGETKGGSFLLAPWEIEAWVLAEVILTEVGDLEIFPVVAFGPVTELVEWNLMWWMIRYQSVAIPSPVVAEIVVHEDEDGSQTNVGADNTVA